MTQAEEPPGLALPAYKMQELAQLVWFASRAVQRYQQHRANKDRDQQHRAAREVQAAKDGLRGATGDPAAATDDVPRPIDSNLFEQANRLASQETERSAQVVSLAPLGRSTWAVTGEVPGVGQVGSEVATQEQAEAVRQMILTAPQEQLGAFALSAEQATMERRYSREDERTKIREEYPSMVREMDPSNPQHRAVARNLLGRDQNLDEVIATRFGAEITNESAESAQQPEPPTTATSSEAVTTVEEQASPVVRESLPGLAGRRYNRIDVNEAMRLYPEPDPRQAASEYRDASGRLLDRDESTRDLVDAIPSWDPSNTEHRRFAAELYGQDETIDTALRNRFEGIDTAMRAHAQRRGDVAEREAQINGRAALEHDQDAARHAEDAENPAAGLDERATAEADQGEDLHDAQVERAQHAADTGSARQAATAQAGVALKPTRAAQTQKNAGSGSPHQQGGPQRRSQQQAPAPQQQNPQQQNPQQQKR